MGCGASGPQRDLELPQKVSPAEQYNRKNKVADNMKLYQWANLGATTPPHIKDIPEVERSAYTSAHHTQQVFDIIASATKIGLKRILDNVGDLFRTEGAFQDYSDVYSKIADPKEPPVAYRWRDDEEFARQRLQGTLPTFITKLTTARWAELQKKFPLDEKRLVRIAGYPDDLSLVQMMAQHRLYFVDYSALDGTRAPPDRHMYAPIALFYVRKDKKLMPAAIQLKQKPDPSENPILMPYGDDLVTNRWLLAKMLFNSSEGCLHEAGNHLLNSHLVMEIVYVALKRTLPPTHPLHELLAAHFWFTLIINDGARNTLMSKEGAVPKVMAMGYEGMVDLLERGWQQHSFDMYNIEKGFKDRGVLDEKELPGYFYRDDGLCVWNTIHAYVKKMVEEFYTSAADVEGDGELQAFVAEMSDKDKGNLRGLPFGTAPQGSSLKATKVDQIVLFCTHVIWACSAYHAALNNGQYDYFGFIPNAPGVLKLSNPSAEASYTIDQVASALPDGHMTGYQVSFIHVLSIPTDQPLGDFKYDKSYMKGEKKCLEHLKAFRADLARVSQTIQARNKTLEVPYTYLDPTQIANGIAV